MTAWKLGYTILVAGVYVISLQEERTLRWVVYEVSTTRGDATLGS
jgi:hypothetical protein